MNTKTGLSILFGVPTLVLTFIYCSLGINNYWQLFLFSFMFVIAYMPGILIFYFLYTHKIRNKVQRDLGDFAGKE